MVQSWKQIQKVPKRMVQEIDGSLFGSLSSQQMRASLVADWFKIAVTIIPLLIIPPFIPTVDESVTAGPLSVLGCFLTVEDDSSCC